MMTLPMVTLVKHLRIYVLRNDIYSTKNFDPNSLKIDVPPSFGVANVNGETVKIIRPSNTEWVQTFRPFIEYTPGSAGTDILTYSICDTFDQCDTAEVTIKAGTADCTIMGTEQDDTLEGTADDDVICGSVAMTPFTLAEAMTSSKLDWETTLFSQAQAMTSFAEATAMTTSQAATEQTSFTAD